MSCPSWEDCNKKNCIEESVCMNGEYWAKYWRDKANQSEDHRVKHHERKKKKIYPNKMVSNEVIIKEYLRTIPRCIHKKGCDKKGSCPILSQCIMTLQRVSNNQKLYKALLGTHTPKKVLIILRDHDISPMKSYYYNTKYWKRK